MVLKRTDLSHLANDPYRISAKNPPKYRGKLHLVMIVPAIAAGIWMVTEAPSGSYKLFTGIYALTIVFMFTASSLFHNIAWSDKKWWRMRRLDHTGIYVLIAGTYLAYGSMALTGEVRVIMLSISGGLIAINITYRWLPFVPFKGTMNSLFIIVGWISLLFSKWLWTGLGVVGFCMLLGGGVVFTAGAIVLGTRKPNPNPAIFGYHEIWHIATVIGVGLQTAGIFIGVF